MTHPDMPELPGEIAYLQPHTLNSAPPPKNFKYCLRKWPDEYRDWFPVYTAAQMLAFREDGIAEALALADEMEGWLRGPRIATDVHSWVGKLRALTYAATKDRHEQER